MTDSELNAEFQKRIKQAVDAGTSKLFRYLFAVGVFCLAGPLLGLTAVLLAWAYSIAVGR